MDALFSFAFVISAVISLAIAWASWRRRPAPGAYGLALLCFAQFGWSATFAVQWSFTDHAPSLTWFLLRTAWLQVTPLAILIFAADFVGSRRWLTPRILALLAGVSVLGPMLLATDPLHGLYLAGQPPLLKITGGGPAFYAAVAYSYALILIAAGLLVRHLVQRRAHRVQTGVVLFAVMLPVTHFLLQTMGWEPAGEVNTVPFTFTLTGALKWYALTRLGLLRVLPVAREQLIEQYPDGIIVFDGDRRIADINPAAIRLTAARVPCIGMTADEAFPEHLETIAALRAGMLVGEQVTVTAPSSMGGVMEASASGVLNANDERIATLVTLRDMTEQTRVAVELAAQREELAAALEQSQRILSTMTEGVLLADNGLFVVQDNPAARRILAVGSIKLGEESVIELLPQMDARGLIESATAAREPVRTSFEMPDGRAVSIEAAPLHEIGADGAQTVLVLRDETERLRAERMQRDFIANVSHELQTPLTGLSLLAKTIPIALRDDPSRVAGFIERLGAETQRLSRVSRELLMFSRTESLAALSPTAVVDMSHLVIQVASGLEPLAHAKNQSISLDVDSCVHIKGDEFSLQSIVENLIGNAIRHTQEGSKIEVLLRVDDDGSQRGWGVLSVRDDGPGIPPEEQSRIFERFYRLDKVRSAGSAGSGLGLSIVRQAAEQHGGTVCVESVIGQGSRFMVRLPLSRD
ncbi:MAG: histidine kinase N-terminal 7TM domain-containing protein [Coriobacteriia bacterium]|nr:histidine kinase N-terminal 7TM domain-containing protein [Coriobacteriia bacterium]